MKHIGILSLWLLAACSEDGSSAPEAGPSPSPGPEAGPSPDPEAGPSPDPEAGPSPAPGSSTTVSAEQLEARRAEVLEEVGRLRQAELDAMAPPFNEFVAVTSPVPAEVPGPEGYPWTPADTEQFGMLSWSPDNGEGRTYAQFHVELSPDGTDFTVIATMDLDGDGHLSRVVATKTQEPIVEDSSIW